MYVSIATNGTLITREKAKQMKDAGVSYLQISIDGADAETHDAFRGISGAFDRTIKGVKNSVAEGFFVSIATTVMKKNLDQVPKIIDLCDRLGANWFMAYNFIPTGRGKSIAENDLSPQEREDLLVMMYNKLKETEVEILTTAPQYARVALQQCQLGGPTIVPTHFMNTEVQGSLFNLTEFIGGCGAGRFYLAIRANGDVSPCVFFPLRVGNILTDDLEKIWKTNRVFEELRNKDVLEDNCGRCDYRYHCGGCRARAYGYFGDYKAADPGCINNVAKYNEMVQLLRPGPRKVE
jgi:radical SAM protein with 4Fe4S-binding SPASM domain